MTLERYRELLSACPELTEAEAERLSPYRPRPKVLAVSVRIAFGGIFRALG